MRKNPDFSFRTTQLNAADNVSLNAIAANAENEARRAASLRRIAIVLQDLPESVALKLLADLGPEARRRVQREVRSLVDVDPMERKRALESFTGSIKRHAARQSDHRSPSDWSSDSPISDSPAFRSTDHANADDRATNDSFSHGNQAESAAAPMQPLKFLDQVDDDDLLTLLQNEHPQTKAVVFASIEPSRAARVLPRLGNAQRQDMLSRIGRLQSLPDEMLADLAGSFQSRVQRMQSARRRNPLQQLIDQNALDQNAINPSTANHRGNDRAGEPPIWNSNDAAQNAAKHVPKSAAAVSPRLRAILAELPASAPEKRPEEDASVVAERLRQITRETELTSDRRAVEEPTARHTDFSTDQVHDELIKLPAKRLCEALARVETRVAILALCGLPNQTADAAIACLPRAAANQVRRQIMSLGSMEIREIDQAKEQVAKAARVIESTQTIPTVPQNGVPQHSTRLAA